MSTLSPWMLLGVLGAAIPLVVHLLGKRRAKTVRFAALEFLLGTDKKLAKRLRLRQLLLLAVRMFICLLIPAILAQPYTSCEQKGLLVQGGPQAAVLIVDNSIASRYELGELSLLSKAKDAAREVLTNLGPEAEIALVTTGSLYTGELGRDHPGLTRRLNAISATYFASDTTGAIERATRLLDRSNHKEKAIFLFAPPVSAAMPTKLPDGPEVRFIDITGGSKLPNLGITDLRIEAARAIGPRGVTVFVDVVNNSTDERKAVLSLYLGDTVVARGELSLNAGQKGTKQFSANLVNEPAQATVRVELAPDSFAADNVRFAIVDPDEEIPVLLVNGDPHAVRQEDELYYVEAALQPGGQGDSQTQPTSTTVDALSEMDLESFRVVVLANVAALSGSEVKRLSTWVRSGGGLFVAAGDRVDPEEYNRTMLPLLPQPIQSVLSLTRQSAKSGANEAAGTGRSLRLSKLELDHPIFSVFPKDAAGIYKARFRQILLLESKTDVEAKRILARYDNGATALLEARSGRGRLLLYTSTLDRDWTDLAIHPGFLPFLQQTVRYLASKPAQKKTQHILVGESMPLRVTPTDTRLEVLGPGSSLLVLEGNAIANRRHAKVEGIKVPGIYRVQSVDTKGDVQERPSATFAANVDPKGSDLRTQAAPKILRAPTVPRTEHTQESTSQRVELWHTLAALLLLALLVESLVSLYGRRDKPFLGA